MDQAKITATLKALQKARDLADEASNLAVDGSEGECFATTYRAAEIAGDAAEVLDAVIADLLAGVTPEDQQ